MPNQVDIQHKKAIRKILKHGIKKPDRTGIGTMSLFGYQMRFDMSEGFPLLTLRKIHVKSVIHETLWFLGSYDKEKYDKFGNTNIRYLLDNGVTFWSDWPYESYMNKRPYRPELPELTMKEFEEKIKIDDDFAIEFGSIGPGYGKQWTDFGGKVTYTIHHERYSNGNDSYTYPVRRMNVIPGFNQIDYIINEIKKYPDSRRVVLNAWKADEIKDMLLPPCHMTFQLYSHTMCPEDRLHAYSQWLSKNNLPMKSLNGDNFPERKLSMHLYIRSQDLYLGNPFNVAEYALLLHMISQVVHMVPHELIVSFGDIHLYNNSISAAKKIIKRQSYDLPKLHLNENIKNIYDFRYEDIKIESYKSHDNVPVPVAV